MATGMDLNTVSTGQLFSNGHSTSEVIGNLLIEEKPSSSRKLHNSGTESNTESAEAKKFKTVNFET